MQYKIPSRLDVGKLRVEFESSYEETGPLELSPLERWSSNTPLRLFAHAIFNATGVWHRELPITPEKILMGMMEKKA